MNFCHHKKKEEKTIDSNNSNEMMTTSTVFYSKRADTYTLPIPFANAAEFNRCVVVVVGVVVSVLPTSPFYCLQI